MINNIKEMDPRLRGDDSLVSSDDKLVNRGDKILHDNNTDKNPKQKCPQCGKKIGVLSGSLDAICKNCGFKDPCCE